MPPAMQAPLTRATSGTSSVRGRAQQVGIGDGRRGVVELEGIRAEVGAGAERLVARAGEHDGADRVVGLGLIQGFLQRADHVRVERIAAFRAVDGEHQPRVLPAGLDDGRHAATSISLGAVVTCVTPVCTISRICCGE